MKLLLRSIATITIFTLGGQIIALATQVVITAKFGAGTNMDAFLAASAAPNYIVSLLLTSLGFVFIPVLVDYAAAEREGEAWQIASGVITLCMLILGGLALGGMIFARPLLQWMIPGLSPESLTTAVRVARITWPTIVATGLVSLLTGIYQARSRFGWPAAVPVIGALVNLGLVAVLARPLGVLGLALAATTSLVLQAAMLLPIAIRAGRFRLSLNLQHPGVRQVLHLLWPLVLAALFYRFTPLIDCYLASNLGEGAISHLGYAFKLINVSALFISAGISAVIFPRMAIDTAAGDMMSLRHTTSWGLRGVWLSTAPAICIGWALAPPFVTVLFRRGQFSAVDALSVAALFQVYLFAMVGMCLGNITCRVLYALKSTRIIAAMGVVEAIAYMLYTPLLAKLWGISGVALAYVLYYNVSIVWNLVLIMHKTGNVGGRTVIRSFFKTTLAATAGGAVAWAITASLCNPWLQLIFGGTGGIISYIGFLRLSRSAEGQILWTQVPAYLKKIRSHGVVA